MFNAKYTKESRAQEYTLFIVHLFVNAFLKKIPFRNMHAVKNYNQIG
jgi:hypothetical protein